jgi:hypothetical protein
MWDNIAWFLFFAAGCVVWKYMKTAGWGMPIVLGIIAYTAIVGIDVWSRIDTIDDPVQH